MDEWMEERKKTQQSVCTKMKTVKAPWQHRNGRFQWRHKQSKAKQVLCIIRSYAFSVRLSHDRSLGFQLRFDSLHEQRFTRLGDTSDFTIFILFVCRGAATLHLVLVPRYSFIRVQFGWKYSFACICVLQFQFCWSELFCGWFQIFRSQFKRRATKIIKRNFEIRNIDVLFLVVWWNVTICSVTLLKRAI